MSGALWLYTVGAVLFTVAGAAYQERERRASSDPADIEATLRPGLDGIVIGLCWPFLVAGGLLLGLVALVALVGRGIAGSARP
jgi:hypothetical protein